MDIKDIDKLAELARLEIPQAEKEQVLKDMTSIMGYIAQIGEVSVSADVVPEYDLKNVMRDDVATNDGGAYTDTLIAEMPDHEGGLLKVKQIL